MPARLGWTAGTKIPTPFHHYMSSIASVRWDCESNVHIFLKKWKYVHVASCMVFGARMGFRLSVWLYSMNSQPHSGSKQLHLTGTF